MNYEGLFCITAIILIATVIGFVYRTNLIKKMFFKSLQSVSDECVDLQKRLKESQRLYIDVSSKLIVAHEQIEQKDEIIDYHRKEAAVRLAKIKEFEKTWVVHQVLIPKKGNVLCLAEVIVADNVGLAWKIFKEKRDSRLERMQIVADKCGHTQLHKVWTEPKSVPRQTPSQS